MSIGFLLVQDFVAILILIFLASLQAGNKIEIFDIFLTLIKGVALFGLMIYLGRKILPLIFNKIAHSQELLFLSSLAWLFMAVAGASKLGFSIEIGGFLAGLALANSSENFQIAGRIRSLRDFFHFNIFCYLRNINYYCGFFKFNFSDYYFLSFCLNRKSVDRFNNYGNYGLPQKNRIYVRSNSRPNFRIQFDFSGNGSQSRPYFKWHSFIDYSCRHHHYNFINIFNNLFRKNI